MEATLMHTQPFRWDTIMNMATSQLVDNLAGHWTELALAILKAAGIGPISVEMELEMWHTLKNVLRSELRWQRAFRLPTLISLSTVTEQVLRKATLLVAQKFEPQAVTYAFERWLRQSIGDRPSTTTERRLYAEIVRQPELGAAFKPPSRADFPPRLRVSAPGG
jgi:hypothetical protein